LPHAVTAITMAGVSPLDPALRAYYERGREIERLRGGFPSGPLELARTRELIERYLPPRSLDVLDVGGGPGVHAAWLRELGHRVHLVDPIELHLEQARSVAPGVSVELGDARQLAQGDATVDVVLLLGPLYHLPDAGDRAQAIAEAHRVLRPGGLLFAAGIGRFAALLDMLVRLDCLHEPHRRDAVFAGLHDGAFHDPGAGFTCAYFHRPEELRQELGHAGFEPVELFNVEGPGYLVTNFEERWADPQRRDVLLAAARAVERDRDLLGSASHLLAVASKLDGAA